MNYSKADEAKIRSLLLPHAENVNIQTVYEIGSTNDELKLQAIGGEKEIKLLIAEYQTKGKGRKGRSFFSPASSGCYMSFLIRPPYSAEECTLLTTAAAAATAKAIESVIGIKADIKWVNDIYIERKKVAGILTEAAFKKDGLGIDYAIVGIGININPPESGFPYEIADIASYLTDNNDADMKNHLIAEVTNNFIYYYQNLPEREFIEEYKSRLFFLGEEITVIQPDETYLATAIDIDPMCHLIVKTSDGQIKTLFGGEISIKLG